MHEDVKPVHFDDKGGITVTTGESMTMKRAAQELHVSSSKIWRLVKDGTLPTHPNPLDRREKLVRKVDVEQLKTGAQPAPRHFASDGIADAPSAVDSDKIKEFLRSNWHPC